MERRLAEHKFSPKHNRLALVSYCLESWIHSRSEGGIPTSKIAIVKAEKMYSLAFCNGEVIDWAPLVSKGRWTVIAPQKSLLRFVSFETFESLENFVKIPDKIYHKSLKLSRVTQLSNMRTPAKLNRWMSFVYLALFYSFTTP